MPTEFKFKPDRHSQFVAQAMLLCAEYEHRIALHRATDEKILVSPNTGVPSYDELIADVTELRIRGAPASSHSE